MHSCCLQYVLCDFEEGEAPRKWGGEGRGVQVVLCVRYSAVSVCGGSGAGDGGWMVFPEGVQRRLRRVGSGFFVHAHGHSRYVHTHTPKPPAPAIPKEI